MEVTTGVDAKIFQRIQKLLNLARDGGATEAEANLAMERAQSMMAEHGLTTAAVEGGGGTGEAREKQTKTGRTQHKWQRTIMAALAESAFVYVAVQEAHKDWNTGEKLRAAYHLIGRPSGVTTVLMMHEYLVKTVEKAARELASPTDERFKTGMGDRLAERLRAKHRARMEEQKREAEARRASYASTGGTANALVVVLEDYAQTERDLNEDMRLGRPPGTTARMRAEQEARYAASRQRKELRRAELEGSGLSEDAIWYVVELDYDIERAVARARQDAVAREREQERRQRPETEAQRARRQARENRENNEYWERAAREHARKYGPSYRKGQEAGDKVGLDTQVGKRDTKRIN